jgi:hypothetical protein
MKTEKAHVMNDFACSNSMTSRIGMGKLAVTFFLNYYYICPFKEKMSTNWAWGKCGVARCAESLSSVTKLGVIL